MWKGEQVVSVKCIWMLNISIVCWTVCKAKGEQVVSVESISVLNMSIVCWTNVLGGNVWLVYGHNLDAFTIWMNCTVQYGAGRGKGGGGGGGMCVHVYKKYAALFN